MPSAVPQLYEYTHVQETREDLDWADRERIVNVKAFQWKLTDS